MNIFVFLKQVPDTEARIRVNGDGTDIVTEDMTFIDSPYDEFAVEQALLTAEANEGTNVTVVTIGPERADQALRDNLAKGAHAAVRIKSDEFGKYDALTTAKVIAGFLKDKEYDLLLFGNKSYGADNALVPSMVAALLDVPQVNLVTKIDLDGGKIKAERQVEGMVEVVETAAPCVVSAQKGLNEPRMKSLKGIMQAKKKEIPVVEAGELIDADVKAGLVIKSLTAPPAKSAGKKFEGEAADAAEELVKFLKDEVKAV